MSPAKRPVRKAPAALSALILALLFCACAAAEGLPGSVKEVRWAGGRWALADGALIDLKTGAQVLDGMENIARAGDLVYVGGQGALYLIDETGQPVPAGHYADRKEKWAVSPSGWLIRFAEEHPAGPEYENTLTLHDPSGAPEELRVQTACLAQDWLAYTAADGQSFVRDLAGGAVFPLAFLHPMLEFCDGTAWLTADGDSPLCRLDETGPTEVLPAGYSLWPDQSRHHVGAGQVRGVTIPDGDEDPKLFVCSVGTGAMLTLDAVWVSYEESRFFFPFTDEYAAVRMNGPDGRCAIVSVQTGETVFSCAEDISERWSADRPFIILPDGTYWRGDDGPPDDVRFPGFDWCWAYRPEDGEVWLQTIGKPSGSETYYCVRTGETDSSVPTSDPVLAQLRKTCPGAFRTSDGYYISSERAHNCGPQLLFGPDGKRLTDEAFEGLPPFDFNEPVFFTENVSVFGYVTHRDEQGRVSGLGSRPDAPYDPADRTVCTRAADGKQGVLKNDGTLILPMTFDHVLEAEDGQGYIALKDEIWHFYDPDGNLVY